MCCKLSDEGLKAIMFGDRLSNLDWARNCATILTASK
jgi:hypothetical protein